MMGGAVFAAAARRQVASILIGLVAGCSSTGPDDAGGEVWQVSGGIGLQVQNLSFSLTGVQLLLDGEVVSSANQAPTLVMTSGFALRSLRAGDHVMSVKVVGQVEPTVSYIVSGTIDMHRGTLGTDVRRQQWPTRIVSLRVGDVVEFPFRVPL
jgi:hypothetical protein